MRQVSIYNFSGYEICDTGYVYSHYRRGRWLSLIKDKDGYLVVNLYRDRKMYIKKVHRLVGQAFVHNPKPDEYDQINHKDTNKQNNLYTNLEWCTNQQNQEHAMRLGLQKFGMGYSRYTGVTWHKTRKEWKASISVKNKSKHIGYYKTEIEAAIAYDTVVIRYKLNRPLNRDKD